MLETAKHAINTDTIEHLRDVAQEAIGDRIPALAKPKRKRRAPKLFLVLLAIVGGVAIAMYVKKMSAPAPEESAAPDPFGAAVEAERNAMKIAPSHATPGA
jgi:hypothetical protein